MLVYFKTQYRRHELHDINSYKIGNKYDGGIITNILLLNNDTGILYTSTDIISNVQTILKDEIKLKIHKIKDLYQIIEPLTNNIIHRLSDKRYERRYKLYIENNVCFDKAKDICNYPCFWNKDECKLYVKETSIIDGSNLIDRLIYRFIELLLIYGIDKANENNIYNSIDSKVELHTLKNTTKRNEIFIPFLEDYKEYLEYIFVRNEYINIIDIDRPLIENIIEGRQTMQRLLTVSPTTSEESTPKEPTPSPPKKEIVIGSEVEFPLKNKKGIGHVVSITPINYMVCCKPDGTKYRINQKIAKLI